MPEITPARYRVDCSWSDVPHLTEEAKAGLLASYPPHQRDARTAGIPALGIGAVWPISVDSFKIDPFPLPAFWPRGYALDVGWNRTAVLWAARDPDADVIYVYSEYYVGQEKPAVHASAIKARGEWIPGCIDPASRGRSATDGEQLLALYRAAGLSLILAENGVEAGIFEVFHRLSTGRIKVFSTCRNLFNEYRRYHRDEHGKVVKKDDHLCDCLRYLTMTHLKYFTTKPFEGADFGGGHSVADRLAGY